MQNLPKYPGCFKKITLLLILMQIFIFAGIFNPEARAAHMMKIGMLEEPKTLNIWLARDRWSRRVLSQIYQPLYLRDPDTLELIPWLAQEQPAYDPETLSYTVKIRQAKWSDGSEFTSEDVAFTGSLIKEFKVPRLSSYWKFIRKIETPDKRTVRFYLKEPMAVFLTRTLTTQIVPKKEWIKVVEKARGTEKPLLTLLKHKIKKPIGSGPFAFKEWRQGPISLSEKTNSFSGPVKR